MAIKFQMLAALFVTILLVVLAGPADAQSNDPDKPTLLTSKEVKGRWPAGAGVAYHFGFEAGPGEVIVMFDFKVDDVVQNVSAQVTDSYGRGLRNLDDKEGRSVFSYFTTPGGIRFVGRYQIKKRQKLVAKIVIEGEENTPGSYKVRVDGAGVDLADK